jgi:hypothetical protein
MSSNLASRGQRFRAECPHSLQSKPRGFFLETSPCEERGCRGCAQVSPPWGTRSVLLCEARPRLPPCVALPCPAEWGGEQRSAPGSALPGPRAPTRQQVELHCCQPQRLHPVARLLRWFPPTDASALLVNLGMGCLHPGAQIPGAKEEGSGVRCLAGLNRP